MEQYKSSIQDNNNNNNNNNNKEVKRRRRALVRTGEIGRLGRVFFFFF